MLWLGSVVCALAGALLLMMALRGRPARGESLVGAHLVTGPVAVAFSAGAVLVLWPALPRSTFALATLALLTPGLAVAVTFVPLMAYGVRRARLAKIVAAIVLAAPFAAGHGAAAHELVQWTGVLVLAVTGIAGSWVLLEHPLRRLRARVASRLGAREREPSQWEREQADWQRGEWVRLPADAGVAALLPHARSLAPDVRAACHERLAAHRDLDPALASALRGPEPADALWYVAHHYRHSRRPFAAPIGELLARLRTTWPDRLRADPHPRPWTGDLVPAFECAIAVLLAGGDVRAELRAWHDELAAMPKLASIAKELARWLKQVG